MLFKLNGLISAFNFGKRNLNRKLSCRESFGAERGIRTPVQLPVTRFRVVRVRPLRHLCVIWILSLRVGGRAAFVLRRQRACTLFMVDSKRDNQNCSREQAKFCYRGLLLKIIQKVPWQKAKGLFWRRERDSNPRTVARNTISRSPWRGPSFGACNKQGRFYPALLLHGLQRHGLRQIG